MRACCILAVLGVGLTATPAMAWQGQCRARLESGTHLTRAALEASVCARPSECDGLAYARGRQLGEHAYLTREGMQLAGLPPTLIDAPDVFTSPMLGTATALPRGYYVGGATVGGRPTLQPAGGGSATRLAERLLAIPEISEIPDGSHSIASYVLGNEHCLPRNVARQSVTEIDRCNSFRAHMGTINSSHWPEQARAVYALYHDIALQTAARCRTLSEARPMLEGRPLASYVDDVVAACEREALVFESYAAHFLEDRWSSGHMFRRWGAPTFERQTLGRAQQSVASMIVGIVHGTRAVLGAHDQVNLPGPFGSGTPLETTVRFFDGSGTHTPGGGDMYLLPCGQRSGFEEWNVAAGAQLARQRRAMLSCVAHGFHEVYMRGPRTRGELTLGSDVAAPDRDAGYSTSDACWSSWLDNRSMALGLRASLRLRPLPLEIEQTLDTYLDPSWFTRGVLRYVAVSGNLAGDRALPLDGDELDAETDRLRIALGHLALHYQREAGKRPDGTDLARMMLHHRGTEVRDEYLQGLLGHSDGNPIVDWSGASVSAIEADGISFYEDRDSTSWGEAPVGAMSCASDDNCGAGRHCDPTAVDESGRTTSQCVPHEAAILRAFRAAELPRWCGVERWESLNAARDACALGESDSVACDACVQMVAPRLRNLCNPGNFDERVADGSDPRSLCEALQDAGAADSPPSASFYVHYPYEIGAGETERDAVIRAAREACLDGSEEALALTGMIPYRSLEAMVQNVGTGVMSFYFAGAVCGFDGEQGFRFQSIVGTPHTVSVRLTAGTNSVSTWGGDVEDFAVEAFMGPACDVTALPVYAGIPVDDDGDGIVDALEFDWLATGSATEELCVRLRALRPAARSGLELVVRRLP